MDDLVSTEEITDLKKPEILKTATKTARECEIVASDRVELVRAANDLVGHFVTKTVLPTLGGVPTVLDLSIEEARAYHSALGYLERQFAIGHRDSESVETRSEREDTLERRESF